MTDPLPPPYGVPPGPALTRDGLLAAYLRGAGRGRATDLHIEDRLLMGRALVCLAIRLDQGVLVRDDAPGDVAPLRAALEEALEAAGMGLVERDTPLGGVIGIELAGLRGAAWNLWAREPESGQAELRRRVAGEAASALDLDGWRRQAEVDAVVADLEEEFGD